MPTMLVNFIDDLPMIRKYIADRVRTQSKIDRLISAIEVGFQLNQAGLLLYHFDTRDKHERDGEWTRELGGPALDLSHWQESYESADNNGASFLLLTGDRHDIPPSAGDAAVASVFGETLLAIALDAIASHSFDTLRLRDDCQLDMEEFDGMWAWPANYDDTGRTNILSKLTATRLPQQ